VIDNHWEGFFGALAGTFMNLNFMLAGSASTNPVLLLLGFLLVLAWKTAGYIGLDRWLFPLLGTPWQWQRGAEASRT
jgi:thiosulfate dehydrogenase [quinone] large subunit